MKYEERVVAFIDILGFKNIVDKTVGEDGIENEKKIDEILEAFQVISNIVHPDEWLTQHGSTKMVSIFSDSIIISFNAKDQAEVFHTLLELLWVQMELIKYGFLCRGAVTYGKLIHQENYAFGPAFIEAYILESKAALYPRIILSEEIIHIGKINHGHQHFEEDEEEYIKNLLGVDSDGLYYIDYFLNACSEFDWPECEFPLYLEKLKEIVHEGLAVSRKYNRVDLRIKFQWLKMRYNEMVKSLSNEENIKRLRKSNLNDIADFYTNLILI